MQDVGIACRPTVRIAMQFCYISSLCAAVHVIVVSVLLRSCQAGRGARSDLPCSEEEDHGDVDWESLSWKKFIH